MRARRISLEAHEDFMEDDPIGDLEQPSQVSGFYCPHGGSIEDLVIIGKQLPIHRVDDSNPPELKVEHHSSNSNID